MPQLSRIFMLILIIGAYSYSQQYADSITSVMLGGINNECINLNAVLGQPSYPNSGADAILSLGGGFVIVDMGVFVINGNGPDLKVYEAGDSYPGDVPEPFYLLGNANNSVTGWQYIGSGPGDIVEIDFDSLNVDSIRYVAIFDAIPTTPTNLSPGADIDAIEALNSQPLAIDDNSSIQKINGSKVLQNYSNPFNPASQGYADSIISAVLGGINNRCTNLNTVLGQPSYPNSGDKAVLSLGGGFVIVDMGVFVINGNGPDLKVYEAGNSYPGAVTQPFYLLGNINNSVTGWQYIGSGPGDIVEIDFDSLNVDSIRYVAIFDAIPTTPSNLSPGADIDAIEALNSQPTAIDENSNIQKINSSKLLQNYPNPFNSNTIIKYSIHKTSWIKLEIYNTLGQKVKTLVDDRQVSANYYVRWNGTNNEGDLVTGGYYFYILKIDNQVEAKKMLFLK